MYSILRGTLLILAATFVRATFAASAIGMITMTVIAPLSIQNLSDIKFKAAYPGVGPEVLPATENSSSGAFMIKGQPGATITIVLPTEAQLTAGLQDDGRSIRVSDFNSSIGTSANISSEGHLVVGVGATREAIPRDLPHGHYSGQYTVQVVY